MRAARFIKPKGLHVLTGSAAALSPAPSMIGYGLSKTATHYIIESLACDDKLKVNFSVVGESINPTRHQCLFLD